MIKNDTLKKSFLSKKELDDFYNSQFELMEFSWLNDVKKWIEANYNVNVITILYEYIDNRHSFTVYLYSYSQYKNIPLAGNNYWKQHFAEAELFISRYLALKENEIIECKLSRVTFTTHAKKYLLQLSYRMFEKKITEFFKYLDPTYISLGQVVVCVLNTQKEAKEFLSDNNYKLISQKIFDLLKPFDDYNILKESDIKVFVDYKEHKGKTPMYGFWIQEMRDEDMEEYEKALINNLQQNC